MLLLNFLFSFSANYLGQYSSDGSSKDNVESEYFLCFLLLYANLI